MTLPGNGHTKRHAKVQVHEIARERARQCLPAPRPTRGVRMSPPQNAATLRAQLIELGLKGVYRKRRWEELRRVEDGEAGR